MDNKKIYETHSLSGKALPFIFHRNMGAPKGKNVHVHWHPNIEILRILEGNGTVFCDNSEYNVSVGDILIVNSNYIHTMYTDEKMIYHCFIPDNEFCNSNGIDMENTSFEPKICDSRAVELYDGMAEEFFADGEFQNMRIRIAVLKLILYISQNYTVQLNTQVEKTSANENIKLALGYIKSHFSEKLTLDSLCNEVGLSKYYFLRKFKECVGCTPLEYTNLLRIEHAKKLLLKGDIEIGEISELCGFNDFSYFSKTFKSYAGCTPSTYRSKA